MPKFRIGTDDFCELLREGGYFVDKSLLIRNVIDGSKVVLMPRPRRFGKTLNMTMLRYFFEKTEDDKAYLFDGLAIAEDADAMAHQGQYPGIYMSLKSIRARSWEEAELQIVRKVGQLYRSFDLGESLAAAEAKHVEATRLEKADMPTLRDSLADLITYLYEHHKKPVIVLIDEYDSPVIEAWKNGYYEEMIDFMRSWLGGGLKHENGQALYRAVVTGILRVAKESVFSGLNNLKVASMLQPGPYADKFGFTQEDVDQILVSFHMQELAEPIQKWYNGYDFGGVTIYNPWSVINCIDSHPAPIGPQWLNTSSNDLIYEELEKGGLPLKRDLEKLLAGEELRYPINESTVFDDSGRNPGNIWSFLFFSGYLKASDPVRGIDGLTLRYRLSIPNQEVSVAYQTFVRRWYDRLEFTATEDFLNALLDGDWGRLEFLLNQLVCNLVSVHDVARYPEAAYHAFVLGLLANLRNIYEIRSNPETGYGRADILMRPKTGEYPLAFVIEFKSIAAAGDLEKSAAEALAQVEGKGYVAQLHEAGVAAERIRKLAIVVSGKRVKVLSS